MASVRSPLFVLILVVYLTAGGLYVFLTPDWQAPDEPAHYNYVRELTTQSGFPRLAGRCYNQAYLNDLTARRFPADMPIDNLCYESHQPPLYYLLGMPVFVLSRGYLSVLRFLSMALLGGGVVSLAFLIGRTIFPGQPVIAYGTMAFVAFVPMHLAILSSINNDVLAELMLAIILLMLVQRLLSGHHVPQNDQPRRYFENDWLLGIVLGLGLGTKLTVYIAIPLVAVVLWWTASKETENQHPVSDWRRLAQQAAIIYGVAFLIILPWFIRNAVIYGKLDILGLIRHDEIVVGQLRTADYLAEVGLLSYLSEFVTTTFHSFWGQFGWMAVPMDSRTYLVLTLLTLTAAGGLIGFWWRTRSAGVTFLSSGQRQALSLMGLTILLVVLAYIWYNLTYRQFQGRYLFPALIPLAIFFALGLNEAFSLQWRWWLVAGLAAALGWIVVAAVLNNIPDKWAILIMGLALVLATGRAFLARSWQLWLVSACYGVLGLLALLSPFWFIAPYLSP